MTTHRLGARTIILGLLATVPALAAASPVSDRYAALGGKTSVLGAKVGEETALSGGGMAQTYEHGAIYWRKEVGASAFELHGAIWDRYKALGGSGGWLGLPITDVMGTYDGYATEAKFQGGELILRPGAAVAEIRTTDTQVDLPIPFNEPWRVAQTYNGVSHGGPWVYCYDFYSADGKTAGKPILASSDGPVLLYEDGHGSGEAEEANVLIQKLGTGRYASSLHLAKGSVRKYEPKGQIHIPGMRGTVKAGEQVADTGDTGTPAGNYHIHYCVTTGPDRNLYRPFESVPVSFRNWEQSKDGKSWTKVAVGIPMTGDWLRHSSANGAAQVTQSQATLVANYGAVEGAITLPAGITAQDGFVIVRAVAPFGDVLGSAKIGILKGINDAGPIKYKFGQVQNFAGVKVTVEFQGSTLPGGYLLGGQSAPFAVAAGTTRTANVKLQASKPVEIH